MAKATLINGKTIQIEASERDWIYLAVRFVDSASPTGKLVKLGGSGITPNIIGWTNTAILEEYKQLPWTDDSTEKVIDEEYAIYDVPSGTSRLSVSVSKAAASDATMDKFTDHSPDNAAADVLIDTQLATEDRGNRIQVNRWKFSNGDSNQVIITIVMIDDQGGGNVSPLRLAFRGQVFEIDARLVAER